jgi:hypothetical protein
MLAEIVIGLTVNAITAMAGPVGRLANPRKKRSFDSYIEKRFEPDAAELVVSLLAGLARSGYSEQDKTRLAQFLRTQDAQIFVRALVVAQLTDRLPTHEDDLRSELTSLLYFYASLPEPKAEAFTNPVFDTLKAACDDSLNQIKRSSPSKLVVLKRIAWDEAQAGYLESLTNASHVFRRQSSTALKEIHQFVKLYRTQVHKRHGYITPPHLDERRKVPINRLYVTPRFQAGDHSRYFIKTSKERESGPVAFEDFYLGIYRDIVLGDPGAGKSTLAHKVMYDFSQSDTGDTSDIDPQAVPFLVVLRDFTDYRRHRPQSVVEYLEDEVNSEYQVKPPPGAIEYLLTSGRALVVFDGLDELTESHTRQKFTEVIESFAGRYTFASILITSRKVGYSQAPLNPEVFKLSILASFDESQVELYANKWFSLDDTLSNREKAWVIESFLRESSTVSDLRSNALMLGLLCNVYRGARSIPRDRADLYEKCALMLFDRWDASRGLSPPGVLKTDARFALQHVAFWMYSSPGLGSGVTDRQLQAKVKDYLFGLRYESEAEAEEAATDFVSMWQGRAWVLTDIGSTGSGENLYHFTHRTFLEYFAAHHLVRANSTVAKLWEVLGDRIKNREWEMVAQLAMQIANASREGAMDQLFARLVEEAKTEEIEKRANLVSFGARFAGTLMPSPKLCRRVARACVDLYLDMHAYSQATAFPRSDTPNKGVVEEEEDSNEEIDDFDEFEEEDQVEWRLRELKHDLALPLIILMRAGGDFGKLVADEIVRHCDYRCRTDRGTSLAEAAILGFRLDSIAATIKHSAVDYWREASDKLYKKHWRRVLPVVNRSRDLAVVLAREGAIPASRVVELYGREALFDAGPIFVFNREAGAYERAIAESLITGLIQSDASTVASQGFDALADSFRQMRHKPISLTDLGLEVGYESKLEELIALGDGSEKANIEEVVQDAGDIWREAVDDIDAGAESETEANLDEFWSEYSLYYPEELEPGVKRASPRTEERERPRRRRVKSLDRGSQVAISGGVIFCGAAMLAVFAEVEHWPLVSESGDLAPLHLGLLQPLESVLLAKQGHVSLGEARAALSDANLNAEDRATLERWASGRFSFSQWQFWTGDE